MQRKQNTFISLLEKLSSAWKIIFWFFFFTYDLTIFVDFKLCILDTVNLTWVEQDAECSCVKFDFILIIRPFQRFLFHTLFDLHSQARGMHFLILSTHAFRFVRFEIFSILTPNMCMIVYFHQFILPGLTLKVHLSLS